MVTIKAQRVDAGGRRRWSASQRVQIVQESLRVGTVEVCRRHRLHPSLLTKWRKRHGNGRTGAQGAASAAARLLPVRMRSDAGASRLQPLAAATATASRAGSIEVELASGGRLFIRGVVEAAMLRTVLEELARS